MLRHWAVTFLGNLAGSLFVVNVLFRYGDVFGTEPYRSEVVTYAHKKQVGAGVAPNLPPRRRVQLDGLPGRLPGRPGAERGEQDGGHVVAGVWVRVAGL